MMTGRSSGETGTHSAERDVPPAPLKRVRVGPGVKLLFRRTDGAVKLVRKLELREAEYGFDYRGRGSPPLPFYYELRTPGGRLLYRGFGHDPTGVVIERPVVARTGRRVSFELESVVSQEKESYFTLTVPRLGKSARLTIYSDHLNRKFQRSGPIFDAVLPRPEDLVD